MNRETFHHGNLRAELIELAAETISTESVESLSLRKLAQRLGVSAAAPYRHFRSKSELLQAVANYGLDKVTAAYEKAERMVGSPTKRLRAACEAYLDFADSSPGLFSLLFFTQDYGESLQVHVDELAAMRSGSAFDIFERLVAAARGIHDPSRARLESVAAWSAIHGFAILKMRGPVQRFLDTTEAQSFLIESVCREET